MNKKTIRVSQKRQITIPKDFFEKLNLTNEIECSLEDDAIILRPIRPNIGHDFSVEILKELVSLGFSGQELIEQFQVEQTNFKQAIKNMLSETDQLADGSIHGNKFSDVFGPED